MTLLSGALRNLSCEVHEDCDGSCLNNFHDSGDSGDLPIGGHSQLLLSILFQIASPHPSPAGPQNVPRDLDWVKQQNLPRFKHSTINSLAGEIRLMWLKKGLFRSDIVKCDIITTFLDSGLEFRALSYCWGSGTMSDVMLCDGKRLDISPSLNAALKSFHESLKGGDQLLWSDAVSIDQANKPEVSEQILLMRRIYTEATGVFVHLGLAERQMSQGLDLMLRLATLQQYWKHPEKYGAISKDDVKLPSKRHSCWTEYFTLFLSPWISRMWILQEIVLAKNASFGIGRYVLGWEVFKASFLFVMEHSLLNRMRGDLLGIKNFVRLLEIKKTARSPDNFSLMEVLRATRNFKVTDPRDKVVAVLGIIGDLPIWLKALSDRSLSPAQIYHRNALYLLKTQCLPDVFAHAGLQRRDEPSEMPSWVPDWYADNDELNNCPLNVFRQTPFLAGGGTHNCLVGKVDNTMYPRELLCLGFYHHRIITRSNVFDYSKPFSGETRLWSQLCAWFASARTCLKDSDALSYENIEEAFARTLIVDYPYIGANAIQGITAVEDVVKTFQAVIARLEASDTGNVDQVTSIPMEGMTNEQAKTFILLMITAILCDYRHRVHVPRPIIYRDWGCCSYFVWVSHTFHRTTGNNRAWNIGKRTGTSARSAGG